MLGVGGESVHIRIGSAAGQDAGVLQRDLSAALSVKDAADHGSPAARFAVSDELVDELHKIVRQSYGDLPAHPGTVPLWDAPDQSTSGARAEEMAVRCRPSAFPNMTPNGIWTNREQVTVTTWPSVVAAIDNVGSPA